MPTITEIGTRSVILAKSVVVCALVIAAAAAFIALFGMSIEAFVK